MAHATDDGRQALFQEVMQRLAGFQAKYRGVRGELLAKLHDELMKLEPVAQAPAPSKPPTQMKVVPPPPVRPSCRACGRTMEEKNDGTLVCQNGHTRMAG